MCAAGMEVLPNILFVWYFGLSSGHGVPELLPKPSLFLLLPSTSHYLRVPCPALTMYDIIVTSLRNVSALVCHLQGVHTKFKTI